MTIAAAVAPPDASRVCADAPIGTAALMRGCGRFVVVAPHPDDETLGVGGILATLARTTVPMLLVAVTDGEASHASDDWWTPSRLRKSRPHESLRALQQLGWKQPEIRRFRLADGGVANAADFLACRLRDTLRPEDCVATTWQHDGHPDHEITARAVLAAARRVGCKCVQFPIWKRAQLLDGQFLPPPLRLRRFALDAEALQRKRAALTAYRSQMRADPSSGAASIVPLPMQRQFLRDDEVLVL